MISYTEKGYKLHELIAESGHSLSQINGVWVSDDDTSVQAIIDAYDPMPDTKSDAIAQIYGAVKSKLDEQSEGYSATEVATWPALQAEIAQYNADETIGPAMQAVIARGRLSADGLSALLTPKINYQNLLLAKRDDGVERISAITDWKLVAGELSAVLAEIEVL